MIRFNQRKEKNKQEISQISQEKQKNDIASKTRECQQKDKYP